jgi:hypothetical protein
MRNSKIAPVAMVVSLLAGQQGHAAILANPAITNSSTAFNGDYSADRAFDGNPESSEYATQGIGAGAFMEFDFGSAVTMDRFIHINRAGDVINTSTLILSNNSDFSSPVVTVGITHLGGGSGEAYSLGGVYTARYARWVVDTTSGFPNVGAKEIRFLNTSSDGIMLSATVIAGSAGYNGNYALSNASNGVFGSDGSGREYAFNGNAGGGATNMFIDFDLGAGNQATSFDLFDRWAGGDRTLAFDLIFSDTSDFSNILSTQSYNKGSIWDFSGTITPVEGGRYVRFDSTDAAFGANSGIMEISFYSVPEPSAALLGGFGVLALLRRRWW